MTLIEQLEKAEGPSGELDAEIRCSLLNRPDAYVEQSPINGAWCVYDGTKDSQGRPRLTRGGGDKPYTSSIDAALTLVADKYKNGGEMNLTWHRAIIGEFIGRANTPALAICAAALKARENNDG